MAQLLEIQQTLPLPGTEGRNKKEDRKGEKREEEKRSKENAILIHTQLHLGV
jgi:hypothetical protein